MLARRTRWVAVGTAAIAALTVAAFVVVQRANRPRFGRLSVDVAHGAVAIGTRGETLWRFPTLKDPNAFTFLRLRKDGPRAIAALCMRPNEDLAANFRRLVLTDSESGKIVRDRMLPLTGTEFVTIPDHPGTVNLMTWYTPNAFYHNQTYLPPGTVGADLLVAWVTLPDCRE